MRVDEHVDVRELHCLIAIPVSLEVVCLQKRRDPVDVVAGETSARAALHRTTRESTRKDPVSSRGESDTTMSERRIRIRAAAVTVSAALNDSPTADAVWDALPITGQVETWGDEIYFSIPVEAAEADDSLATVDKGAVAYWPPGSALCLFWGPTPMSRGDEIRPASAVNVLGAIDGDPTVLARARSGARIVVERAE